MQATAEKISTRLLSMQDVTRQLQISRRKLTYLTLSGEISHIRIGRQVRYEQDDIDQYLHKHRHPAKEQSCNG